MIKQLKKYMLLLALLLGVVSCTDVIDLDLPDGETLLVVDGWIYNTPGPYTITLSTTAPYFQGGQTPRVTGAVVRIADSEGFEEELIEVAPGKYQTQEIQGKVGNQYLLTIEWQGNTYEAGAQIKPGAVIDSLTYKYKEEYMDQEAGYFLYYWGWELPTEGDHYYLRLYQNGQLWNKPDDLMFVSDQMVDGNYIHDLSINWEPFQANDLVKLEMLTITEDTYQFLLELDQQTNNGGMFPNPIANVRTNVLNKNPQGPKAVGYFGGAAVDAIEGVINPENNVIKP